MQTTDIINIIERTAPPVLAAPWDRSGLQVASFRKKTSHLAVMLDPTPRNLKRGIEAGADFMLAHHPLSMAPELPCRLDGYHAALSLLFSNDIPLYSAHTSLDANPEGPVRWLGRALGLENMSVLEPGDPEGKYGFGFVGTLPDPLDYKKFCAALSRLTGKTEWSACGPQVDELRRIACCPGSGGSMIGLALQSGADLFISGDVKYHAALEAGLRVIDLGHFQLEETMMRHFAAQLESELQGARVTFIESEDPLAWERP